MPNIDLNKVPKQFCENVLVARSKESFIVGMLVGETGAFYALSPQHFKRLVQNLQYQLQGYEKDFGAVDAEWVPGVQSPIQTKDVQGGSDQK